MERQQSVIVAGAGGRVGARAVRGIRFHTGTRLLYAFSKSFNRLLDEIGLAPR